MHQYLNYYNAMVLYLLVNSEITNFGIDNKKGLSDFT